jgi:hypothetical protein
MGAWRGLIAWGVLGEGRGREGSSLGFCYYLVGLGVVDIVGLPGGRIGASFDAT